MSIAFRTGSFSRVTVRCRPAFASAFELARLGLAAEARRELGALGFRPPANRDPVSDPERIDWLLASSLLLDLAGDYEQSHWIGRWHSIDYRRHWPTGDNAKRWRLAYPLAFWELVQEFAAQYTYPAHLQIAIVREESAFDPARDTKLRSIDASRLFESNIIYLGVRRNDYLRGYMFDFIEMFAPRLDRKTVLAGMQPRPRADRRPRGSAL